MGGRVESGIKLKVYCSNTMLNYWFSQKFKLLGNCEFNHLTIVLTKAINISSCNKYLKVQEITLTNGSSINLLFLGLGSIDGFEHSTFKNIEIEIGNEVNMTSSLNKRGLFANRAYNIINIQYTVRKYGHQINEKK